TGRGQHIEVAQVEAAMQFIGPELIAGTDLPPDGNRHPGMAPHNAYPTLGDDSWIAIAAENDAAWAALAALIGGAVADPRFATLAGRKAAEAELDALIAAWTAPQDRHALADRLQATGIAASAVETMPDLA